MADKEEIAKRIGKNITNLLILNGKTQQDLCNDLEIGKSTVSSWCNGTRIPRMPMVDRLCQYFGVSRSRILGDTSYVNVQTEGQVSWYDDPVMQQVADRLKNNSDYRMLFEAASNIRPEDISFVTEFIKRMGGDV